MHSLPINKLLERPIKKRKAVKHVMIIKKDKYIIINLDRIILLFEIGFDNKKSISGTLNIIDIAPTRRLVNAINIKKI
jgi:hypothetical protein